MHSNGRSALCRGFSIVEAIIALGLVMLALVSLFDIVPRTYRAIGDDSLRAEAAAAAHRYLDDVTLAVQTGQPVPGPTTLPLATGSSIATGEQSATSATVSLSADCVQPKGAGTPLYDCTVSVAIADGGETHTLSPAETFITRQLP